jgi:acetyl esterase/lipase
VYQQQARQGERRAQAGPPASAPRRVVFFVHGGIWAGGERWQFCALATCLAQAGLVVVVPSYTL